MEGGDVVRFDMEKAQVFTNFCVTPTETVRNGGIRGAMLWAVALNTPILTILYHTEA
jgi:hypothetical protein